MARTFSLPQNMKISQVIAPATTNAAVSSTAISFGNAHKAWIVLDFKQAVGFASVPTLNQCTSAAKTTNKAGPAVPIWANEDTAATDTLVRQARAASYTMGSDVKNKQVVFEITPGELDIAGGYTWVYITIPTSAQATNFVSATAYLDSRYKQATPPSAIV